MRINKNSWHFRLYDVYTLEDGGKHRGTGSLSLCPYVRGVLRGLCVALFVVLMGVIFGSIFVVEPIGTLVSYISYGEFHGGFLTFAEPGDTFGTMLLINVCMYTFALLIVLAVMYTEYVKPHIVEYLDKLNVKRRNTQIEAGEPPTDGFLKVLGGFFKAVHDKVCPIVEVVDSKEGKK